MIDKTALGRNGIEEQVRVHLCVPRCALTSTFHAGSQSNAPPCTLRLRSTDAFMSQGRSFKHLRSALGAARVDWRCLLACRYHLERARADATKRASGFEADAHDKDQVIMALQY